MLCKGDTVLCKEYTTNGMAISTGNFMDALTLNKKACCYYLGGSGAPGGSKIKNFALLPLGGSVHTGKICITNEQDRSLTMC